MTASKYHLTDNMEFYEGKVVYQIRACRDFGDVKNGDLGGWVTSHASLSHEGNCWIDDQSYLIGDNIRIGEDAVLKNTIVTGRVIILGSSLIENSDFNGLDILVESSTITNSYIDGYCNISYSDVDYSEVKGNLIINSSNVNFCLLADHANFTRCVLFYAKIGLQTDLTDVTVDFSDLNNKNLDVKLIKHGNFSGNFVLRGPVEIKSHNDFLKMTIFGDSSHNNDIIFTYPNGKWHYQEETLSSSELLNKTSKLPNKDFFEQAIVMKTVMAKHR